MRHYIILFQGDYIRVNASSLSEAREIFKKYLSSKGIACITYEIYEQVFKTF